MIVGIGRQTILNLIHAPKLLKRNWPRCGICWLPFRMGSDGERCLGGGVSVYVDEMAAEFGRMKMCHMLADSTDELLAMADSIGVQRKWIQAKGTYREHFDICKAKRSLAIKHGAIEITSRDVGLILIQRKSCSGEPERKE